MSTPTEISAKILQLGPGAFQAFCDSYLKKKGYKEILALGKKAGTSKTTIGNPDSYFSNHPGKYVCVVYTTQQSQIDQKIEDDINKCFSKEITGIETKDIEEIIACHTSSTLTLGSHKRLTDMCKNKDIVLTIYGIDEIAEEVYAFFPTLAKDYLNLSLDTEQIFTLDDFITYHDNNRLTAPYDIPFLFREKELQEIKSSLQCNEIIVLLGKAGTGKTRLGLESCKQYAEENLYTLLCFKNNDLSIFDDLRNYIENKGNYLLFIDDANEFSDLVHILQYLPLSREDHKIKIVLTIRDYARQKVLNQIGTYGKPFILCVEKFNEEQIKNFMSTSLGITNPLYLDQIDRIAEGNPRIAYMIGKTAKDSQKLKSISNASELFSQYYGKFLHESTFASDGSLTFAAGILSFVQTIDLLNIGRIELFLNEVSMTIPEFEDCIKKLHFMEFVDIHFNQVVTISDQCFSNYMLYNVLYEKKLIPLDFLIDIGFRYFKNATINVIDILLNVFYSKELFEYISKVINTLWLKYKKEEEEPSLLAFATAFQTFFPVETLCYINNKIKAQEEEATEPTPIDFRQVSSLPIENKYLSLLTYFSNDFDNIETALELIFKYCKKQSSIIPQVAAIFQNEFSINNKSLANDYFVQQKIASFLSFHRNDSDLFSQMFISVAQHMLDLSFSPIKSARGGKIVITYNIPIQSTAGSKEYRSIFWNGLLAFCKSGKYQEKVLELIDHYATGWGRDEIDINMILFDTKFIKDIFFEIKGSNPLKVAQTCSLLLKKYEHYQVLDQVKKDFTFCFECKQWPLFSLLTMNVQNCIGDLDENEIYCKEELSKIVLTYSEKDYPILLKECSKFILDFPNQEYCINSNVAYFFAGLQNELIKLKHLTQSYLLLSDNQLDIYPNPILQNLFLCTDVMEIYELIASCPSNGMKNKWQFAFFETMSGDIVTLEWGNRLLSFLDDESDREIKNSHFRNMIFLDKFLKVIPNIYILASEKIIKKTSFVSSLYFEILFNRFNSLSIKHLLQLYSMNIKLLESVYLKTISIPNSVADYNGTFLKAFIECDPSFLLIYTTYLQDKIDKLNERDIQRTNALWDCNNYVEIFDFIYEKINQQLKSRNFVCYSCASFFKGILSKHENKEDKSSKQKQWLKHFITLYALETQTILNFFSIIAELNNELKRECIVDFITINKNYETFENLEILPLCYGGVGPFSNCIIPRIEFLESLLPFLTGLELLQHRKYIADYIKHEKQKKEKEQIREFLGYDL